MAKGNRTKQIPLSAVHASTAGDAPIKRRYERELENLRTKLAVARGAKDLALDLIASHQREVNETRAEMQRQTKNLDQIITMERQRADMFVGEAVHNRDKVANLEEQLNAQIAFSASLIHFIAALTGSALDNAMASPPLPFDFRQIIAALQEADLADHIIEDFKRGAHPNDTKYAALLEAIAAVVPQ